MVASTELRRHRSEEAHCLISFPHCLPHTVQLCGSLSSHRSSERIDIGWSMWLHLLGCPGSSCPNIRHPKTSSFTPGRGGMLEADTNSGSASPLCMGTGRRRTQKPLKCLLFRFLPVPHLALTLFEPRNTPVVRLLATWQLFSLL